MKILVTGGSGFIGSYVVDHLIKNSHETFSIDRTGKWRNDKAKYYECNILNSVRLDNIIKEINPDIVIHLAGILGTSETWRHVQDTVDTNIIGSVNVYESCKNYGCNILTVDVGSRWLSPYTITKKCEAELARAYGNKYGLKVGILRIFNVYGPRQSTEIIKIIPKFIENSFKNATLEVWGDKCADLVHVDDVGRAFSLACTNLDAINGKEGILIGSGDKKKVYDVACMISQYIGFGKVQIMNARNGEEKEDAGYMSDTTAWEYIKWKPEITLEVGLPTTIEWYKNYLNFK